MNAQIPTWVDGTLVPFDKLDAHHKGLKHKAVSVFVLDGDRILLQQRALGKYHTPGLWANTCCTHPDWGETTLDCANRRLKQELGITGLTPQFRQQLEYRADVGGGMTEHEVVDVFVAVASQDMRVTPNPDEVMDVRWLRFDALVDDVAKTPDAYTPWLKIYLADHSDAILGADLVSGK